MAFLIPEAIFAAPEIAAGVEGLFFGSEAIAATEVASTAVPVIAEAATAEAAPALVELTSQTAPLIETSAARGVPVAANVLLPEAVSADAVAVGRVAPEARVASSSVKSVFGKLPKIKPTTAVIGGTIAADSTYHLIQNIGTKNQTLKEGLLNVPGGVVKDAAYLADYGGEAAGKIVGSGVKGASKAILGDENLLWELGILAVGLYFWTR